MATPENVSNSGKGLAIATSVAVVATLVVNMLSNFFPPGGENVGQIANTILRGVLIIPANYAFAIWGIIYLGLIAYSIYQFQPAQRGNPIFQRVDVLLIAACVAQIAWIFLFTLKQFWLSVPAMLVILGSLIGIYQTLEIGQNRVRRKRRWMVHIPFSIYLAWISVATIVNIAAALYASGWDGAGLSNPLWTMILLIVSGVIAAIVAVERVDIAFTLVFIWAYIAIAVAHFVYPTVWISAVVLSILLLGMLAAGRNRKAV